jgi:tRNA(Ile)-lysidine synthase
LELRNRRSGDYLTITADGKKKSVKEYFIEEKIPREERDGMALLADGNHILWVVGMRISEHYKVTQQTTNILQVTVSDKDE